MLDIKKIVPLLVKYIWPLNVYLLQVKSSFQASLQDGKICIKQNSQDCLAQFKALQWIAKKLGSIISTPDQRLKTSDCAHTLHSKACG